MLCDHDLLIAHDSGVWLLEPEVFISMGWNAKPEGRGQTTPKIASPCASRTTIFNQMLTGHRMSTGRSQSTPIKTQLPQGQNTYQRFCHTAHTRAHLISCVSGLHRNHIPFKPSSTYVRPYGPFDHTAYSTFTNCLTCHAPTDTFRVQSSHRIRNTPTCRCGHNNMSKHWLLKPSPIGSNKTCINSHTYTLCLEHTLTKKNCPKTTT